jgi:hypothetical protein
MNRQCPVWGVTEDAVGGCRQGGASGMRRLRRQNGNSAPLLMNEKLAMKNWGRGALEYQHPLRIGGDV